MPSKTTNKPAKKHSSVGRAAPAKTPAPGKSSRSGKPFTTKPSPSKSPGAKRQVSRTPALKAPTAPKAPASKSALPSKKTPLPTPKQPATPKKSGQVVVTKSLTTTKAVPKVSEQTGSTKKTGTATTVAKPTPKPTTKAPAKTPAAKHAAPTIPAASPKGTPSKGAPSKNAPLKGAPAKPTPPTPPAPVEAADTSPSTQARGGAKKPKPKSKIQMPVDPLFKPGAKWKPLIPSGPKATPTGMAGHHSGGHDNGRPVFKTTLGKRELDGYRKILLLKRAELVGDIRHMEDEALRQSGSGSLSQTPQHMADQGSDTFEQSLSLDLAAVDRNLIREIDDALKRIDEGTYGMCERTGVPINQMRLSELPWARYSIEAARELERRPYQE